MQLAELQIMTDAQIEALAAEYKRLENLIEREQSKANMNIADIHYYEDKMAAIETQFQKADLDIALWIR